MKTWGISANSHDAAIAIFNKKRLIYAGHSERYSKQKNDGHLSSNMISMLLNKYGEPDEVVWYENPLFKSFRQLRAGQGLTFSENNVYSYLKKYNINAPVKFTSHHRSHAAAGYYTSQFREACVVVIDAIGEFETLTIWDAKGNTLNRKYSMKYPHSVGLWYSAMTQRCGLKPNEEEYILMGAAALGNPDRLKDAILNDFIKFTDDGMFRFKRNLHRGCKDWRPDLSSQQDIYDIAAATQHVYEMLFWTTLLKATSLVDTNNLIIMGGCALNCVANKYAHELYKNVWIMPNPGDAGSSIGAVLSTWNEHIHWPGAYLGYDMGYRDSNTDIVDCLLKGEIAAVARGRSEFGPRALGNRSLLADPRLLDVKDRLNKVKKREPFRPFAPAVLAEHAHSIFKMPCTLTPYMQYAVKCKYPELYPGIVHVDGTSRVQTVTKQDNPEFRKLLEEWYAKTGCPMLVNTSLNIKGEPMVNDHEDADRWEQTYNIKIFR